MLKKTITYTDFNDVVRTEDFYFNLSKADIAEVNLKTEGGLVKHLREIAATNNGEILVEKFKDLIKWAYGVKSDDGKRFVKTEEVWVEFTQTNAYSELFMELATDAQAASEFMNGIVPADMAAQVQTPGIPQDHKTKELPTSTELPSLEKTQEEIAAGLMNMTVEEHQEYLAWQASKNS
jgi:hypothetical protein